MLTADQMKPVRAFLQHGVDLNKIVGEQAVGTCPFTDKPDRFYVNVTNQLWDSKSAGYSGNLFQFFKRVCEINEHDMTPRQLKRLAQSKDLPIRAFKDWGIGYNGSSYTIPVYNGKGTIIDVRLYNIKGGRCISTAGANVGLLNLQDLLDKKKKNWPVYICEGEWDTIAMRWLLNRIKSKGVVVGVTGAGTFKEGWVDYFKGRDVYICYDNDEPGKMGERKVYAMLDSVVDQLHCLHWDDKSEGYDVRDLIVDYVEKSNYSGAYRYIKKHCRSEPRVQTRVEDQEEKRESKYDGPIDIEEVRRVFNEWLYLKDTNAIEVCLAVMVSQIVSGDPVWMFLVAAPGGSKTETIQALGKYRKTVMISQLTPHSLLSGSQMGNNDDPSLLPQLNGKTLLIKDFTSIINMNADARDEVFGILRDAYDGEASKKFGNGITRHFKGKFTILAGVTPIIYSLSAMQSTMGERFLKLRIGDNLEHHDEDKQIAKAISNTGHETDMRAELADACTTFLEQDWESKKMPSIPGRYLDGISHLARFGSALRGTVTRDKYKGEMYLTKPTTEVGTRFAKQLAKLGIALGLVRGVSRLDYDIYTLLKRITLDSVDQRVEDVVREIFINTPGKDDTISARQLAAACRYPVMTITRIVNDLNSLRVIQSPVTGRGQSGKWQLTDRIKTLIDGALLYSTETELDREFDSTEEVTDEETGEVRVKVKIRRRGAHKSRKS